MDGTARVPEGLPRVERSFEASRLSGQFASLAYEQAVAVTRESSTTWSKNERGPGRCESIGADQPWRWAVGG